MIKKNIGLKYAYMEGKVYFKNMHTFFVYFEIYLKKLKLNFQHIND